MIANRIARNIMPATHPAQDQPSERAPRVADGLVDLVRRLAAFGRDLLGTLQRGNTGFPSIPVAARFGTISLALIIARITRGLLIAQALEDRLLRNVDEGQFRAICQNALEGLASKKLNLEMLVERRAMAQERRVVPETIARFVREERRIAERIVRDSGEPPK